MCCWPDCCGARRCTDSMLRSVISINFSYTNSPPLPLRSMKLTLSVNFGCTDSQPLPLRSMLKTTYLISNLAKGPIWAFSQCLLRLKCFCRVGRLEQELQAAAQQQQQKAAGVVTWILRRQSGGRFCRSFRARTPSLSQGSRCACCSVASVSCSTSPCLVARCVVGECPYGSSCVLCMLYRVFLLTAWCV